MLAHLASAAETYAETDATAAIIKLRQFGELLVTTVSEKLDIALDGLSSQHDRLITLGSSGHLPRSIADSLHRLRKAGNNAVHHQIGTVSDAHALMEQAFVLARWFRANHAPWLSEPPEAYVSKLPVRNDSELVEQLRQELDALRELMHAREDQAAPLTALGLAEEMERLLAPHRERYESQVGELQATITRLTAEATARASTAPLCPITGCGSLMEEEVSKKSIPAKGIEPGTPLWRCRRFPACRGWRMRTAPTAEVPKPASSVNRKGSHTTRRSAWTEYGMRNGWKVRYINCGARLRAFNVAQLLSREDQRALSQSAIFTTEDLGDPVDEAAQLTAFLLRRILARGLLPPIDPRIEAVILEQTELNRHADPPYLPGDIVGTLRRAAGLPSAEQLTNAVRFRQAFAPCSTMQQGDGTSLMTPIETTFYSNVLPGLIGSRAHWCHPQASLDAVGRSADGGQRRVDFLLASPDRCTAIEIDDRRHASARAVDRDRDSTLAAAGIGVVRVSAETLMHESWSDAEGVLGRPIAQPVIDKDAKQLIWAPVVAHRIAMAMAAAVENGWLRDDVWELVLDEPCDIGVAAISSAMEIIAALSAVWDASLRPALVHVWCADGTHTLKLEAEGRYSLDAPGSAPNEPSACAVSITVEPFCGPFHLLPAVRGRQIVCRSTYLPVDLIDDQVPGGARPSANSAQIPDWALTRLLQAIFGKNAFLQSQEEAVRRLLGGGDTAVLLPTGAGKSMIYQLAGLLMSGLTLIVDPIVALIEDQVDGLSRQGIDRTLGITAADRRAGTTDAKLARIEAGDALFVFVAPERLQQKRFRDALRVMTMSTPVSLIVVDEAHCVSEWGHDFRTSYLDIGRVLRDVCADPTGRPPPLLALTGTASRAVLKDMLIELSVDRGDPAVIITPSEFDRPELRYQVQEAEDDDVLPRLVGIVQAMPSMFREARVPKGLKEFCKPRGRASACGIVFCQTVGGERGVATVESTLGTALQVRTGIYAGKAPKGVQGFDELKRRNAHDFKENQLTLLVATKSYGMGIDKPNVRYIVHVGLPSSIEAYYQETGRAGRDKQEAVCVILQYPKARETLDYFHGQTFRGAELEVQEIADLLRLLPLGDRDKVIPVPFKGAQDELQRERALHRLKLLGVIRDYTVDWGGKKYEVKVRARDIDRIDQEFAGFVRRYQPGRVPGFEAMMRAHAPGDLSARIIHRATMLVDYVYETIVAARERAVEEMDLVARQGNTDAVIRDRILRYLALGRVAQDVEAIMEKEHFSFADWLPLLSGMETLEDAREWRGVAVRMLESDPDNPGLLLGRSLAEAAVANGDVHVFSRNLERALAKAHGDYSVSPDELAEVLVWVAAWLRPRQGAWAGMLSIITERAMGDAATPVLQPLEAEVLFGTNVHESELAVVMSRRLTRTTRRVRAISRRFEVTS
jgi:ATP-dependent DNA helicase RecQ